MSPIQALSLLKTQTQTPLNHPPLNRETVPEEELLREALLPPVDSSGRAEVAKEGLHSLEQILKTKARHPNQSRPWVKIMEQEEGGKTEMMSQQVDLITTRFPCRVFDLLFHSGGKISLRITATYRRPTASLMVTRSLIFSSWTI